MIGLKKKRRIQIILLAFVALAGSTAMIGYGMRDGIEFFRAPAQLAADPPSEGEVFRIGGLVKEGSITAVEGVRFSFVVTDGKADVPVAYVGNSPRPDLFSEGTGTVATGTMQNGVFQATEILAKHDESYMPREVIDALKEQGTYVDPKAAPNG